MAMIRGSGPRDPRFKSGRSHHLSLLFLILVSVIPASNSQHITITMILLPEEDRKLLRKMEAEVSKETMRPTSTS